MWTNFQSIHRPIRVSQSQLSMECPSKAHRKGERSLNDDKNEQKMSHSLATERIASSIPRGDGEVEGNWLYPSPSMFFNAMLRKGHQPNKADMEVIVNIHNMVNEQTWQQILRWENYYYPVEGPSIPRLKRFLGRPSNVSPKAWLRTNIMGYKKPFDRHDWFVEGKDGVVRRYVIDFYSGKGNSTSGIPSFHIDARPAVDDWHSAYARTHCCIQRIVNSMQNLWNQYIDKGGIQ